MLLVLKVVVGLLFGLIAFAMPVPMGGEPLFAVAARYGILCGIALGLFVYTLKGRQWLAAQLKFGNRKLRAIVIALFASGATYVAALFGFDSPSYVMVVVEVVAYSVLSFLLAFLLTMLGALLGEVFYGKPPGAA